MLNPTRASFRAAFMALAFLPALLAAQRPTLSAAVRRFVAVDTAVVVLRHARVIDGTGAPAREDQVLVISGGRITASGADGTIPVPAGALEMDLTGQSVIPGYVMLHEHLYYPTGGGAYANLTESFPRLYLAGGVTAMRTGGNMNGYVEINTARAVANGQLAGPWIDATAPYVTGPGLERLRQLTSVHTALEAKKLVDFWADAGATSVKIYMHISRGALKGAIDAAHARGMKVTGHLCSVTYAEAAELGIDDLEHGFFASTDFVANKQPDVCQQGASADFVASIDTARAEMKALIGLLVRRKVALTSTLTIFETFAAGRPLPRGLELLTPQLKEDFERIHANLGTTPNAASARLKAGMAAELAFARAGGLLVVGTDPTGAGGLVPGYSNQRAVELLVEAGFTPLEAIRISTLNGARYLGREADIGSIAVGKQADLVIIAGDPSRTIADVRNVRLVFKQGIGYDPERLIASVRGRVGLH